MKLPVVVYFPSGSIERGILNYSSSGVAVSISGLENKRENESFDGVAFSIQDSSTLKDYNLPIAQEDKVQLESKSVLRAYSSEESMQNEMYPKSSGGWITHFSRTGSDAKYIMHPINDSKKKLLVIIDGASNDLLSSHMINEYEGNFLLMETDWDLYKKLFAELRIQSREELLSSVLDSPPPKWSALARLVEGVNVPDLQIHETMRDTMDQLVPDTFPSNIREELMAFLALSMKIDIQNEDPLVINNKYRSTTLLHSLVFHHMQCLIEKIKPPQYVRIFNMADRGFLQSNIWPASESAEKDPWNIAWLNLMSMFKNRFGKVLDSAMKLNLQNEILTCLPITANEAARNSESWIDRFALILYSLSMRGHIHNRRLGLRTLVYIGSAHRWPHKHLAWTARLGNPGDNPPYIQVMTMPPTAVERIRRIKPAITEIVWSSSNINFNLYSEKKQNWRSNTSRILGSLSGSRTFKQLKKEFDVKIDEGTYNPNQEEARVLGFLTFGLSLDSLELGEYESSMGMSRERFGFILSKLQEKGIVQLQYALPLTGLASICITCDGPLHKVLSLSRAFLKHTPSSTVRIANDGERSIIISRMSENSAYEILTKLPSIAVREDVVVKILRIDAYAAYNHNLYERLLLPDESWDDDISGFLSQIRS